MTVENVKGYEGSMRSVIDNVMSYLQKLTFTYSEDGQVVQRKLTYGEADSILYSVGKGLEQQMRNTPLQEVTV